MKWDWTWHVSMGNRRIDNPIKRLDVSAYAVPTESLESDGTLAWDKTTLVLVKALAGDNAGIGFTPGIASAELFVDANGAYTHTMPAQQFTLLPACRAPITLLSKYYFYRSITLILNSNWRPPIGAMHQ